LLASAPRQHRPSCTARSEINLGSSRVQESRNAASCIERLPIGDEAIDNIHDVRGRCGRENSIRSRPRECGITGGRVRQAVFDGPKLFANACPPFSSERERQAKASHRAI